MSRILLIVLVLAGVLATGNMAQAAATQAYKQCLQRAVAFCRAETAQVKWPNRARAYSQCFAAARRRCAPLNRQNRLRSTPLR